MRTNLLTKLVVPVAATLLAGLTSCGSTSRPPPGGGRASINAVPGGKYHDRIKGVQLISVNGTKAARKETGLPSGSNNVRLSFQWPQGGMQEVNLKFNARQNQKYTVKYDPFPPTADQFHGTSDVSDAAQTIASEAYELMALGHGHPIAVLAGAAVLVPAIALGSADFGYRVKESIREGQAPVQYVDLYVISDDGSEGVVRRVRAYPNGRLLSEKLWDHYHYTPGHHYRESLRTQSLDDPPGLIRYNQPDH